MIKLTYVIPAKAGIQSHKGHCPRPWAPAFAGVTGGGRTIA